LGDRFGSRSKTYNSAVRQAVTRQKATVLPSGETVGSRSPGMPAGGQVTWRRSPVSTRTAHTAPGPPASDRMLRASVRPSGAQLGPPIAVPLDTRVRLGPPNGETRSKV